MSAGNRDKARADREAGRATPGAHLRAELRRLGLDQVSVSKATGVSRQSVNNIINGRQPISRAMAGKLGRLTGYSSDYWLSESFGEAESLSHADSAARRYAVAGLLVNHQIARAVKDGIIGITPFAAKNLRTASIELTLHASVRTPGGSIDLARGKAFEQCRQRRLSAARRHGGCRAGNSSARGRVGRLTAARGHPGLCLVKYNIFLTHVILHGVSSRLCNHAGCAAVRGNGDGI